MWVINPAVGCHLSAWPAVTHGTLGRAATNFAAWWMKAQCVWTVCLRLLPNIVAAAIWTQAYAPESSTLTTEPPKVELLYVPITAWNKVKQCFFNRLISSWWATGPRDTTRLSVQWLVHWQQWIIGWKLQVLIGWLGSWVVTVVDSGADGPRFKSQTIQTVVIVNMVRMVVSIVMLLLLPFNGLFSRTTWVSRYQKGKTNLDFTEARDSEWQWHQLDHMQVCTSLQTDNHASTPPLSFLQAGCPSCRPTNSVKALKAKYCDVSAAIKLNFHMLSTTRGIAKNASRYNLRKFSFCSRVVNIWNSLPDSVVDAYTINTF